ncbi:MAG TPA: 3'-5' exonuclease [Noviherbaspirillum sp.]|nr:3'-5' exonuclease [Noviherbaspirillum sp.]
MSGNQSGQAQAMEAMACELEQHPDYRVIRRFAPRTVYVQPDGRPLRKGIVVDTETTGTSHDEDKVIELGMVAFEFDPQTGQVYRIVDSYNGFDDPGMPIPPESTAVHSITDDMVTGQALDAGRVAELLDGAAIVIAHNALFDRPFLEARLPQFANVPWACSLAQLNWSAEGLGSHKLDYIAYQFGFFYEAHRAEADCLALLEILRRQLPASGITGLKRLLDEYLMKNYRVWARGSRFDTKDLLKQHFYRWEADEKCWHKTVGEPVLSAEVEWLKAAVYGGRSVTLDVEVFDAYSRFSKRPGRVVSQTI